MRPNREQAWKRLAQGVCVAVLTIGTMFTLSYTLGRCVDVPAWRERNYGYTFHCTNGGFWPQGWLQCQAMVAGCWTRGVEGAHAWRQPPLSVVLRCRCRCSTRG